MIRTVLVDDEKPARDRLRRLLADYDDLIVVAEARDGGEAIERIDRLHPDLVLLDIQMPGYSGLEVAARLAPPRPDIIFCTAFDQYAIRAFEVHALDYLLKPVRRQRLSRALERVRQRDSELGTLRSEIAAAGAVQRRLFPGQLPHLSSIDYSGVCLPAKGVGGDYYDFLPLGPRHLGIAVGDVSGKGVYAGLLMASLQGTLQSSASALGPRVDELMVQTNQQMWKATEDDKYATLFYGYYDDLNWTLTYCNAGHLPPLWCRGSRDTSRLQEGGTAVGLFPASRYRHETVRLLPGDLVVIFTDGVTEARDLHQEEFGETRLLSLLKEFGRLPALELREKIVEAVGSFCRGVEPHDDVTVVVLKVRDSVDSTETAGKGTL